MSCHLNSISVSNVTILFKIPILELLFIENHFRTIQSHHIDFSRICQKEHSPAPVSIKSPMQYMQTWQLQFICHCDFESKSQGINIAKSISANKQEAMWLMAQLKEYISAVLWWYDDLIFLCWKVCTWMVQFCILIIYHSIICCNGVTSYKLYRHVE